MNEVTNTTATPAAPVARIMDLEGPIADASRMASILSRMLTDAISRGPGASGAYYLTTTQSEDMLFAAYHTEELIGRISTKLEEMA
jgi:hypothetical protein